MSYLQPPLTISFTVLIQFYSSPPLVFYIYTSYTLFHHLLLCASFDYTDDGSGGGSKESMSDINKILPAKSAFYGRYAQVSNGKTFDGNQIYSVMDDIKNSGAILQASVMPYGTWYGLTESDNKNAIAIAKVCNDIYKNYGIEVWLRFAHESEFTFFTSLSFHYSDL